MEALSPFILFFRAIGDKHCKLILFRNFLSYRVNYTIVNIINLLDFIWLLFEFNSFQEFIRENNYWNFKWIHENIVND